MGELAPNLKSAPALETAGEGPPPAAPPAPREQSLSRRFRWLPLGLFVLALALYATTTSPAPFPGPPARALVEALRLEGVPSIQAPLWEGVIRLAARIGFSPAAFGNYLSVLCGALGIALLSGLMVHMPYRMVYEASAQERQRERQARLFSGLTSGLCLLASIPWWIASTRSLPQIFHSLILWGLVFLFLGFAHTRNPRWLFALGLGYAAGTLEYPTLIPLFPVLLIAVFFRLFRTIQLKKFRPWILLLTGLLLGVCVYPLHALVLNRMELAYGLQESFGTTLGHLMTTQQKLLMPYQNSVGFMIFISCACVPWFTIFVCSRRSPWFYGADQILMRVVIMGLFLAILYNAPFSFWNLLGMPHLTLFPYLLMATATGYITGEFWIYGQRQLQDKELPQRLYRSFFAGLPFVVIAALILAVPLNLPITNARPARRLQTTTREALDQMGKRTHLLTWSKGGGLSEPWLEDLLSLELHESKRPIHLVDLSRLSHPSYLLHALRTFPEIQFASTESPSDSLFMGKLSEYLCAPTNQSSFAFLQSPPFSLVGLCLIPQGLLYFPESTPAPFASPSSPPPPLSYWNALLERTRPSIDPRHPLHVYSRAGLNLLARNANEFGVLLADAEDFGAAKSAFRTAERFQPDNLSALLNQISLSRKHPQSREDLQAISDHLQMALRDDRGRRWLLDLVYGPLWQPDIWARQVDWLCALSGTPLGRINPPTDDAATPSPIPLGVWKSIFLFNARPIPSFPSIFLRLSADSKDITALRSLARNLIRINRPALASSAIKNLLVAGLNEADVLLEMAALEYLRGHTEQACELARQRTVLAPSDPQGWLALLFWTAPNSSRHLQALQHLEYDHGHSLEVHFALAIYHFYNAQWDAARAQLDQTLHQGNSAALQEYRLLLARLDQDPKSIAETFSNFRRTYPHHPLFLLPNLLLPNPSESAPADTECPLPASNQTELDIAAKQKLINTSDDPYVLNACAESMLSINKNMTNAMMWIQRAIRLEPWNPIFICTRSEVNLNLNQLDEAADDALQALSLTPEYTPAWVLLGGARLAQNDVPAVRRCFNEIQKLPRDALSASQKTILENLTAAIDKTPSKREPGRSSDTKAVVP